MHRRHSMQAIHLPPCSSGDPNIHMVEEEAVCVHVHGGFFFRRLVIPRNVLQI